MKLDTGGFLFRPSANALTGSASSGRSAPETAVKVRIPTVQLNHQPMPRGLGLSLPVILA